MLSEEEKREIEEELAHYENRQAVSVEALKVVQNHRGWVDDDGMQDVSDFLGLSVADLEGVATFYNLIFRRPVGRHVILLCDSVSCWICGYESQYRRLSEKLGVGFGQTTEDDRFTLLPTVCLGACEQAPAMMVDGELHGDIGEQDLDRILERYS